MKRYIHLTCLCLGLILASCTDDIAPDDNKTDQGTGMTAPEFTPDEHAVNDRMNEWAFDIFNLMASDYELIKNPYDPSDNIIFSPLSASIGLSMLANSVKDDDMSIACMLGTDNAGMLSRTISKLMTSLSTDKSGDILTLANSVWYKDSYNLSPDYDDFMRDTYAADIYPADFTSTKSLDMINGWANEKTAGLIPALLSVIDPNTHVMLLNAMYFDGKWQQKFDAEETKPRTFYGTHGETEVDMMLGAVHMYYTVTDNYSIGTFDFVGPTQITIAVPSNISAIDLAKSIRPADIAVESPKSKNTILLPKCRLTYKTGLKAILALLGVHTTGSIAPMGINNETDINMVHSAVIEFNEDGAKAAAVTGGALSVDSGPGKLLRADRPFLFFIRNTVTGSILICGCVNNI